MQSDVDARRKLELRLLRHYMAHTGSSIADSMSSRQLWEQTIPELAVQADALLFALCAVSALHISAIHSPNHRPLATGVMAAARVKEYMQTCDHYLSLAVEQHARDVAGIRDVGETMATTMSLTASLLRVCYLGTLQHRRLHCPYKPPIDLLRTMASSTALCMQL